MSTNLFNLSLIKGNSEQLKGHCCCIIPEELCEFTTMSMPLVVDRYKGDTAAFQKSKGDIADFQKCALVQHRHFSIITNDLIGSFDFVLFKFP